MTTTAITSQTTAATSSDIAINSGSAIQIWTSPPLEPGETVALYRYDGTSEEEAIIEDGVALVVSDKMRSLLINGPISALRLKKSVTATATAVYYDA